MTTATHAPYKNGSCNNRTFLLCNTFDLDSAFCYYDKNLTNRGYVWTLPTLWSKGRRWTVCTSAIHNTGNEHFEPLYDIDRDLCTVSGLFSGWQSISNRTSFKSVVERASRWRESPTFRRLKRCRRVEDRLVTDRRRRADATIWNSLNVGTTALGVSVKHKEMRYA